MNNPNGFSEEEIEMALEDSREEAERDAYKAIKYWSGKCVEQQATIDRLTEALHCLGYWRGHKALCFCEPKREGTIHTVGCATADAALREAGQPCLLGFCCPGCRPREGLGRPRWGVRAKD
jgi:hypothetical protein